ncbi:hypothetical protein AMTR_s00045p00162090 [Amborella trichopoda]|uniref:Uncharacterized protein n=1 Tax=Amborella trichopoda TaxID=13333 RepID=W1P3E8_AMBTC|nr:hypothetical protein AMTR_s00045p00162090 [Amborella trichopoda]
MKDHQNHGHIHGLHLLKLKPAGKAKAICSLFSQEILKNVASSTSKLKMAAKAKQFAHVWSEYPQNVG